MRSPWRPFLLLFFAKKVAFSARAGRMVTVKARAIPPGVQLKMLEWVPALRYQIQLLVQFRT